MALPSWSWLTLVRQEPNAIRGDLPGRSVLITDAGRSSSVASAALFSVGPTATWRSGGHTWVGAPSTTSSTSYAVTVPGSSPETSTRA